MSFSRKYNIATVAGSHIRIPIVKAGSIDFALSGDWTPAAGDVKVSKDSGVQANIGSLPTFTNGAWQFVFTAAELLSKTTDVTITDAATKAIEDQAFVIETYGNALALHPFDLGTASAAQSADNDIKISLIPTTVPLDAASTATVAKQNIAQTDLDKLTGLDGVTLATAQANYAPAKAGDAMAVSIGGIPVGAFAAGAINDAAIAADAEVAIANQVWAKILETHGSLTAQQILRVGLAAWAGVTAVGGSVLKTPDGIATKISATINASNERTAIALTPDA